MILADYLACMGGGGKIASVCLLILFVHFANCQSCHLSEFQIIEIFQGAKLFYTFYKCLALPSLL